jgi:hypothetical protein
VKIVLSTARPFSVNKFSTASAIKISRSIILCYSYRSAQKSHCGSHSRSWVSDRDLCQVVSSNGLWESSGIGYV